MTYVLHPQIKSEVQISLKIISIIFKPGKRYGILITRFQNET